MVVVGMAVVVGMSMTKVRTVVTVSTEGMVIREITDTKVGMKVEMVMKVGMEVEDEVVVVGMVGAHMKVGMVMKVSMEVEDEVIVVGMVGAHMKAGMVMVEDEMVVVGMVRGHL